MPIKIFEKKKMVNDMIRALRRFKRRSKQDSVDIEALSFIMSRLLKLIIDHQERIQVLEANILRLRDRCGF